MRICSGSGCLRAVADDVRFCLECAPVATAVDGLREHTVTDRERYAKLYSGKRWQRTRDLVIRLHPLCDRCQLRISDIADHRVPAGVAIQQARDSGAYPFDRVAGFFLMSNLQGLCRSCHWDKTLEDKLHTGAWPDVVAIERASQKRVYSF